MTITSPINKNATHQERIAKNKKTRDEKAASLGASVNEGDTEDEDKMDVSSNTGEAHDVTNTPSKRTEGEPEGMILTTPLPSISDYPPLSFDRP